MSPSSVGSGREIRKPNRIELRHRYQNHPASHVLRPNTRFNVPLDSDIYIYER